MDKLDLREKILGGVFGIISIVSALAELMLGDMSASGIFGAVKDISGTLIVVILLVMVVKMLRPQKKSNFREIFDAAMEKVERNYRPLIRKAVEKETDSEAKSNKLKKVIRYQIASKTKVLFGQSCNDYIRFFDIDAEKPENINFYIREKFFGSTDAEPFDYEKIASDIIISLSSRFPNTELIKNTSEEAVTVKFESPLSTQEDAEMLSALTDFVILLYVAHNKKG